MAAEKKRENTRTHSSNIVYIVREILTKTHGHVCGHMDNAQKKHTRNMCTIKIKLVNGIFGILLLLDTVTCHNASNGNDGYLSHLYLCVCLCTMPTIQMAFAKKQTLHQRRNIFGSQIHFIVTHSHSFSQHPKKINEIIHNLFALVCR